VNDQDRLLNVVLSAHLQPTINNDTNVSSTALKQSAAVGKGFPEAMASAILTLGNVHGPVTQARHLLYSAVNEEIITALEAGNYLPGYGNDFHKDGIDPSWEEVNELMEGSFPEHHARIWEVAGLIEKVKDRKIYPNPGAFTAATAEIIGLPPGTEHSIVVMGRMPAWTQQYAQAIR
jgi:citrate synthase